MFKAKKFKKTKALKTGYPKSSPMPEGGERVKLSSFKATDSLWEILCSLSHLTFLMVWIVCVFFPLHRIWLRIKWWVDQKHELFTLRSSDLKVYWFPFRSKTECFTTYGSYKEIELAITIQGTRDTAYSR